MNRYEEVILEARKEYEGLKEIMANEVKGTFNFVCHTIKLDPPARVKVTGFELGCFISGWLDPCINVESSDPRLEGYTSLWVYGTGRNVDGRMEAPDWRKE